MSNSDANVQTVRYQQPPYTATVTKNSRLVPHQPMALVEENGVFKIPLPPNNLRAKSANLPLIRAWCALYPNQFSLHDMKHFQSRDAAEMNLYIRAAFLRYWWYGRRWRDVQQHERNKIWEAMPNNYNFFNRFSGKWAFWWIVRTKWQKKNDNDGARGRDERRNLARRAPGGSLHENTGNYI
jgi:hypothetical protein